MQNFHTNLIPRLAHLIGRQIVRQNHQQRALVSAISSASSNSQSSNGSLEPEAYMVTEKRRFVIENILSDISDQTRKLFAVIYIQRKQFKVIQDDLIHVEHNIPLDIGEEIEFEKVLLVGGKNFTLIGRPLIDPNFVHVRATVIEKTTTSPEVEYNFRTMRVHNPLWLSQELTVLRINDISVEKPILGQL